MRLMIDVEDCDAVCRQALAAGAKSLREAADQYYVDRGAGVEWWLATHIREMYVEEMHQATAEQAPA